jgi:L-ascorbate metabolism protein UlaG (beta-lactamase superfamily)
MEFLASLIILIAVFYGFYRIYPPLGGRSKRNAWTKSKNFRGRTFVNQLPTDMTMTARDMVSLIRQQRLTAPVRQPQVPLPTTPIDVQAFLATTTPQFIWLGHSSVLLRVAGKTILTDPMLSKRSSPVAFFGPTRTISDLPITAEELPNIDVVLISHDHYDHLDYQTIQKLKNKTTTFFVPLGLAAHLRRWGIPDSKIEEHDWWETTTIKDLNITSTPSRHFSGRGLTDRFKTLWGSWVVEAAGTKIFFSGDTGYGPHFKEIGTKFGPFDLTLMECGQYDTLWSSIHMTPEQTVQAHLELRGKRLLPIHWGAFALALHPWNDSVRRAQRASRDSGVDLISSRIGEMQPVHGVSSSSAGWWEQYR